jgi:hypothetical protein
MASDNQDAITFRASFPAIQSAIIISGDGTGVRIKLDVPEVDLLPFLHTLAMRQTAFKVTIEPIDNDIKSSGNDTKSTY